MRTFLSLKTCLLSALLLCANSISASKIISVSDFGLKPDSRINAVPFIQKAIDACKQYPGSTLVFPKGRYGSVRKPCGYVKFTLSVCII